MLKHVLVEYYFYISRHFHSLYHVIIFDSIFLYESFYYKITYLSGVKNPV